MPLSRITSASIANSTIAAADIANGTITAAKIVSIANTQITGNIVSSQITSVGGSQITANTIANSAFQTGSVENYMSAQGLGFGMRNRIINGAMVIDQRNAGASVTPANLAYTLDRWQAFQSVASKYSVQQNAGSVTPPAGFQNYLGVTSLSAYSVASNDYFALNQSIEGFNVADFGWGTASASTITLSFWVRSSLTGTFGGALKNSASNRSYPFTYTISSANTWEQKTIIIAGDTSGTWLTNNGVGIYVQLGLGTGSTWNGTAGSWSANNYISATGATSVVGTNGATFYITGVQLEKGSTATSFDYRPYGTELVLCQRYFFNNVGTNGQYDYFASGNTYSTSAGRFYKQFSVTMRTAPSFTGTGSAYADGRVYTGLYTLTAPYATAFGARLDFTGPTVFNSGEAVFLAKDQGTAFAIAFSAEF